MSAPECGNKRGRETGDSDAEGASPRVPSPGRNTATWSREPSSEREIPGTPEPSPSPTAWQQFRALVRARDSCAMETLDRITYETCGEDEAYQMLLRLHDDNDLPPGFAQKLGLPEVAPVAPEQRAEELVEADPEESAEAFMARREAARKKPAAAAAAPAVAAAGAGAAEVAPTPTEGA